MLFRTYLAIATALFAVATRNTHVEAFVGVQGGDSSVAFTGTSFGETQEIRTPIVSGFESFTVSFWHKVVTPRSNLHGTNSGIPGSLWSYWAMDDGPSAGSGWAEKRANKQDVFKSTPVFSAYAYNANRFVKHNGHRLSPGEIPSVSSTLQGWYHYVFTYDGARREIVKYEWPLQCLLPTADLFVPAKRCKMENTTESVADAEYFKGLADGRVPKGMFRFGQSDPTEPTLTLEMDDLCIFNKAVSPREAADIQSYGCDSVSGLALQYKFDQRRAQSPDLFDSVSGTYNGVSRTYLDLDDAPMAECSANGGGGGNLTLCEDAMVPLPHQGVFSKRLMLDSGADIGPVTSNRGAESWSTTSATLNLVRGNAADASFPSFRPRCKGECGMFVVTSLPTHGDVIYCYPASFLGWPEEGKCFLAGVGSAFFLQPKYYTLGAYSNDDTLSGFTVYYRPTRATVPGQWDSFSLMASGTNATTSPNVPLHVQLVGNTPPSAIDSNVTLTPGTMESFFLPGQSEFMHEPDGNREEVMAEIVRIEYDDSVNNPPQLTLRRCKESTRQTHVCDSERVLNETFGEPFNVTMPYHQTPLPVQPIYSLLRDVYVEHTAESGKGVVTIVYRLFDGIDVGPEAKLFVTILEDNQPPVAVNDRMVFEEDPPGGVPVTLSALTTDREGDVPLWRVTQLPAHGRVFQVHADGSKGNQVQMTPASKVVQQWTDGSLGPTATSEANRATVNNIDGPPVLFPEAGDLAGTYTPAADWDRSDDVTLVLKVREPVFLTELSFFFTWGPGAVVQIETQPSSSSPWQVVYSGDNTQQSYCVDKPLSEPCADITRHRLCPKPYKASAFRVTLSAASPSHSIAIDAVMALGRRETEANIVVHPQGKLLWEPDQDFFGDDALGFVVDDCPAFQVLGMAPPERPSAQKGMIFINVTEVNDAPVLHLTNSVSGNKLHTTADQSKLLTIAFTFTDVDRRDDDDDSVVVSIHTLPNFGSLWLADVSGEEGQHNNTNTNTADTTTTATITTYNDDDGLAVTVQSVDKVGVVVPPGTELRYQPGQCEEFGTQDVSFKVLLQDSLGAAAARAVELTVDCTTLPLRWSVDLPGNASVVFGIFCAIIGLCCCLVAIYFNIAYRKHIAVRISSFRINVAMLVGCAMIFGALLSMSLDRPAPECFVDGLSTGLLDPDGNVTSMFTGGCPNANCFTRIWLLDCGAALTWGSLYAKTYRIKLLFMAKDFRVKSFTDKDIARGVATYLVGTVAVLIGFSAYIGWPELTFTPKQAVMSNSANEKLIAVAATCSGGDTYAALSYVSLFAFALLQGLSAYIAFTVRHVDLKQVNDSKQIAIAIYTSFVIGLPGIVVGGMVESSDLSFVITAFSIFFATISVVVSMTVPRMLDVYYNVEVQIGVATTRAKGRGGPTKLTARPTTYFPSKSSFQHKSGKSHNMLDSKIGGSFVQTSPTSFAPGRKLSYKSSVEML